VVVRKHYKVAVHKSYKILILINVFLNIFQCRVSLGC